MDTAKSSLSCTHNMRVLSLTLLCVLFVSHGLLVLGHDPWLSNEPQDSVNDDDFIDFTDMVNYDPVTKTMVNKKEKVQVHQTKCGCDCEEYQKAIQKCREDLGMCEKVKIKCEAESPPTETGPNDACSGEEMFFKRFARYIVDKLAEQDENGEIEAKISVNLSPSSWRILKEFVYSKKGRMAEAYDELTEMITYVDHANVTTFVMRMENWLQMDRTSIKVLFYVTILAVVIVMFETRTHLSWLQQLWTVIIIFIFISIFWNWLFLYKKEVAKRMAQRRMEPPEHCLTGKMTLWDSAAEALRSRFTFNEDPCKIYNEQVLVDPLSEVPPTKAIALTFASLFLEPAKHLGKAVAEFNHELFANLPLQAWIPALLSVYGGIILVFVICMRCTWGYTREPQVIYKQVEVPAPMVRGQPQRALDMGPLPGLPAREDEERIEEMLYLDNLEMERGPQDVRRRPIRQQTSRTRRVSDNRDDIPSSPQQYTSSQARRSLEMQDDRGSALGCSTVEQVASVTKSQEGAFSARLENRDDSTDSEDYNKSQKGEESRRRRTHKRSVSPPVGAGQRSPKKSEAGRPMSHPESEPSSIEQQSLMQSMDSSTVLVSSARHMPPPTSLVGDLGGGQTGLLQEGSINSSDGSTPTLSPPQCNTPSSVSVIGDEASLASSDELNQDTKPALERVHLSVSGELEPEALGAEGGSMSGREGGTDDDDFEVLHKEQIPQH